jgi:hypothetical protein
VLGVGAAKPSIVPADEIDTDWMTGALRAAGLAGDASVVAMSSCSIGTGQVGENVRFELRWDRDDAALPASVVGKFPSRSELSRESAKAVGTYVREIGFYRDAQPLVSITTPTIHHLGWDADSHEFVLLMNDLRDAATGDQLRGCTPEQAADVVTEAVGLHAPTWGATDRLRPLDWVGFPDAERTELMVGLLRWAIGGFTERFADRLDRDDLAVGRRLVDGYGALSGQMADWAETDGAWCLVHGDFRLDNLLFGVDGAVTVVDWQTVSVGIGPADVAYFIGSGLLAADRRAHERTLMARYGEGLRAAGVDVDDDTLWSGYELGTASGYLMAVIASQLVEQTERGDEMFAVMAERHAAQIRDVGLLGRLDPVDQ